MIDVPTCEDCGAILVKETSLLGQLQDFLKLGKEDSYKCLNCGKVQQLEHPQHDRIMEPALIRPAHICESCCIDDYIALVKCTKHNKYVCAHLYISTIGCYDCVKEHDEHIDKTFESARK